MMAIHNILYMVLVVIGTCLTLNIFSVSGICMHMYVTKKGHLQILHIQSKSEYRARE